MFSNKYFFILSFIVPSIIVSIGTSQLVGMAFGNPNAYGIWTPVSFITGSLLIVVWHVFGTLHFENLYKSQNKYLVYLGVSLGIPIMIIGFTLLSGSTSEVHTYFGLSLFFYGLICFVDSLIIYAIEKKRKMNAGVLV